jgi:hypothetical protein
LIEVEKIEIPSTDPRLGRHIEHDPRSREFAYVPRKALPQTNVRHNRYIPVFDQGNLGSCTGNAGLGCLGTNGYYDTVEKVVTDWTENAAVKLYSEATVVDSFPGSYPPDDTGSSGLAVAKVLKGRGWISEYRHTFSFEDALAALQERPVITGVNWYNSFFSPDSNGVIRLDASSGLAGGHEFILDEIDWDRKLVGAQNSWGTSWGVIGRFYIPFDVYRTLLDQHGDVTVFTPVAVAPEPAPVRTADQVLWGVAADWAHACHYAKTRKVAKALLAWAEEKGLD